MRQDLQACPARPGATEAGECPAEKNPVWAREDGECHRVKNPVWARVWARDNQDIFCLSRRKAETKESIKSR
jgi:hypothetical protein